MQNIESMPRPEIILVADTVAREKNIDKEDVFTAMEVAIQKAGRSKYGFEHDIRANIDRKTGAISLARYREVVEGPENVENEVTQLTLEDAKMYDANAKVGDFIIDQLPPIDFGRIAAQTAKQVIVQKVRDAERNKQFEEYKEKIGTIVNGTIKRIEFGNVILDIGKTEAILRRDEIIPREKFKNGDRVRAYVLDVRRENKGPQVFLSRTCPEFMAKLFTQEVPEIYDGIVKIMGVARDPGSKAKIAVKTDDMTIDPVGACVAYRRWLRNCRARKSILFLIPRTRRSTLSAPCRRPKSPRWFWTRKTTVLRRLFRRNSFRWPSAAAARMSSWLPSCWAATLTF